MADNNTQDQLDEIQEDTTSMEEKIEATETTTKQVNMNRNPTGKGGFKEHPESRSPGGWSKLNNYSYWMHYFKSLIITEFREYKVRHPEMTMAALGAYARVAKSIDNKADFQEVANRTEGMPIQMQGQLDDTKIEQFLHIYKPEKKE